MSATPEQLAELTRRIEDALAYARTLTTAAPNPPSSASWLTEDEEVAWVNSLGFSCTLVDLRASYSKFVPRANKTSATSVQNDTETDDLRNYHRLWKRTGHPGFLMQAQYEHDWQVVHMSNMGSGLPSEANVSHFYCMGLIDWWVERRDQTTLDAIHRLIDFVVQHVTPSLVETRTTARPLQCLAYYQEKVGIRDVSAAIKTLVGAVKGAPINQGFVSMPKFYVGTGWTVDGQPVGTDLRSLFPANAALKNAAGDPFLTDATHYQIKGFPGAASFQDAIMMHALGVAARVLGDASLLALRDGIARAYAAITGFPIFDPAGVSNNMVVPYTFVTTAPDLRMFVAKNGSSTPLYVTNLAPFCTDPQKRRILSQQALLRQYGQHDKIQTSELGKPPRFFAWATFEQGYYLTQK